MKFVLFVEGYTEQKAIPAFLKRWLDERLNQKVGIKVVRFEGWPEFVKDLPIKASMHLNGPDAKNVIAVIGLLDLYGPTIYPAELTSAAERKAWATEKLQKDVAHERFRMFFAVHDIEAWLLSDPNLFPPAVRRGFSNAVRNPETVNFDEPPAKLLERLYRDRLHKKYKKVTEGGILFSKLSPDLVCEKCPNFKNMMDELLALARSAGL